MVSFSDVSEVEMALWKNHVPSGVRAVINERHSPLNIIAVIQAVRDADAQPGVVVRSAIHLESQAIHLRKESAIADFWIACEVAWKLPPPPRHRSSVITSNLSTLQVDLTSNPR
jgi:hypothetical protein